MRPPRLLAAIALGAAAWLCAAAGSGKDWRWDLPAGVDPPPIPAGNPMSAAKVALGRRLFYDADLSIDGTMSCGSCHAQRRGFADGNRTRPGVHGEPGRRNVPGLSNVAWASPLTWGDPRLVTLEAQLLVPLLGDHPVEMGMTGDGAEVATRLARDPCYSRMFAAAFPGTGGRIAMPLVAQAIAAFERTIISRDSGYDRYRRGDVAAFPVAAARGAERFGEHCAGCHAGADFSDYRFHAIERRADAIDRGLAEVTGDAADDGRFRTPGLRNAVLSAPYLHDGSAKTLPDALRRHRAAATISDEAMGDLIAFLVQLTDARLVNDPRLAAPERACGQRL